MDRRLADLRAASPRSLGAWGLLGPATTGTRIPLGQFDCADWRRAGPGARGAVVRRITAFVGGRVGGAAAMGWGTVLAPGQAEILFDGRCRARGSDSFLLYKLYGFTAGFAGVAPPDAFLR
jgi:hypothetical protein